MRLLPSSPCLPFFPAFSLARRRGAHAHTQAQRGRAARRAGAQAAAGRRAAAGAAMWQQMTPLDGLGRQWRRAAWSAVVLRFMHRLVTHYMGLKAYAAWKVRMGANVWSGLSGCVRSPRKPADFYRLPRLLSCFCCHAFTGTCVLVHVVAI